MRNLYKQQIYNKIFQEKLKYGNKVPELSRKILVWIRSSKTKTNIQPYAMHYYFGLKTHPILEEIKFYKFILIKFYLKLKK